MSTCRSPHDQTNPAEASRKKNALHWAIALGLVAFVGQVIGAYFTGSLSLLGDTAHVFTDIFSLVVSLAAITLAARPLTEHRSFGLYRLEVLATFLNGILLVIVSVGLIWESIERLQSPRPILALPLVAVAFGGMLVNLVSALLLARAMKGQGGHAHSHSHGHDHGHDHDHEHGPDAAPAQHDRNLHGALLHVMSDALGSLAVVVGGVVTYFTDWLWVDPALAIALALVILRWSSRLLYDAGHVLLEGTPRHLRVETIETSLRGLDGRITQVEDLHVWEITSRMYAATAEVRVQAATLQEADDLRKKMHSLLKEKFGIAHVVLALRPR